MILTYTLLALAVLSLWLGGDENASAWRRQGWLVVFAVSLISGFAAGIVRPAGLVGTLGFGAAVFWFSRAKAPRWQTGVAGVVVLLGAVSLMLHRVPGFENARVISAVRFSPDAIPFTLFLNYDKTLIGLFILGWCHSRIARRVEWRTMLVTAAPWAGGLIFIVLLLSLAAGYLRFEPKFPGETWLWLGVNLGFTCVAEEALFRGFIQTQLQRLWSRVPVGSWLALGVAAVLFGLAHFAGGAAYVALATVAGLGYGWIYQRTGRIEASILTHFTLNAAHFFLFTYPALARVG